MKTTTLKKLTNSLFLFLFLLTYNKNYGQQTSLPPVKKSEFWKKVQFGGGLGLAFGNFTNVTIAPSARYNFNEQFSLGTGVQYSYISANNNYKSNIIGGSIFGLYNPVPEIQLSLDIEQLNVQTSFQNNSLIPGSIAPPDNSFWTTALFVGGGYNFGGVTIGGRYNVLFDKNKSAYSQAFMPFVRAFF